MILAFFALLNKSCAVLYDTWSNSKLNFHVAQRVGPNPQYLHWMFRPVSYHVRHDTASQWEGGRPLNQRIGRQWIALWIYTCMTGKQWVTQGRHRKQTAFIMAVAKNSQRPKDHGSWAPPGIETAKWMKHRTQPLQAQLWERTQHTNACTHTHRNTRQTLAKHAKLLWGLCQNWNFLLSFPSCWAWEHQTGLAHTFTVFSFSFFLQWLSLILAHHSFIHSLSSTHAKHISTHSFTLRHGLLGTPP